MENTEGELPVVIVGTGVAGLMAALHISEYRHVILLTKSDANESNSSLAQGGVAAAIQEKDTPMKHALDTIQAGHGHNVLDRVKTMTDAAPDLMTELARLGVPFDRKGQGFAFGQEGAHGERRILHANKDQTGKAIVDALFHSLSDHVQIAENEFVIELIRDTQGIAGVLTDRRFIAAREVVLATGGAGQLYQETSNVKEATGDGIVLAWQAGAELRDLEFVQFHPTLLGDQSGSLISEAVRGEGAWLVNEAGERLLQDFPKGELEGRDVVARVLHQTLLSGEQPYLDVRHLRQFSERFPTLAAFCLRASINPKTTLIPVVPGAHFFCGGVWTDACGRTSVDGLYAIGETACTGVHGANRLASNSLLEGLTFAQKAAEHIACRPGRSALPLVSSGLPSFLSHELPSPREIRTRMTTFVGIERSRQGLAMMEEWLSSFQKWPLLKGPSITRKRKENEHLYTLARLVTRAAALRSESRGGHYRSDSPASDESWKQAFVCFQKNDQPYVTYEKVKESV
ncbi:L-aspartate oxidase [Shouchella shacheensis]|uniref:L-aspartate oxidase n=1 Tax=Shouchella shacheensis TaxID=1649580 RepID=UPI00073FE3ED|nr:L-aspartate oxidase [Shouchella shacheensis]